MQLTDLMTPCLVVDADDLAHNIATMARARPGPAHQLHVVRQGEVIDTWLVDLRGW